MTRWLRFFGILGLVVFVFGLLGVLVSNSFTLPIVMFHLVLGLILMLLWLFSGAAKISNLSNLVTGRRSRFAGNVILYTVVFVGLLVVINYMANRHDLRWDLTEAGAYSLSDQSTSVVAALKKPLKIVVVSDEMTLPERQVKDLTSLYQGSNPSHVTTQIIDARAKPQLLDTYGIKQGNVAYLEYGEGDKKAVSRINDFSEQALTNAIIKLTHGDAKKIYFVQGHDELGIDSDAPVGLKTLADSIRDEHLEVAGIVLSRAASVPADAAAVVLVSPKKELLPEEKKMLIDYVKGGGRLLILSDPHMKKGEKDDARDIATVFGIEIGDNVVIDQLQRPFMAPTLGAQPMVLDYANHGITKNFSQQTPTIFNIASSVRATGKNDETTTYTDLVKTGPTAWGETNLEAIFNSDDATAQLDEDDLPGPLSLAAVYEKRLVDPAKADAEAKEANFQKIARLVVFGDSDWVMNQNLGAYANRDLFLNALNWLAGEEGGVTIRPKSLRASYAPIPRASFALFVASSFVVPELLLILGLFIWWRRKTAVA
ncbi:MAG: Gldg family protein [Deltaproteobacteria bacterium]|nr:Gldg family protein [Deltaproteobacteria bacterium]